MITKPNILITGTPGTGKTTTSEKVASLLKFKYINVGEYVKEHKCYEGRDETFDAFILDEDKLIDELEPIITKGGYIIDFHSCEIFPERWFDLVLVLRASTEVLYDRLTARGYNETKRTENIECEIMQVVLEAAMESYEEDIVQELQSNTTDDLENNIQRISMWYEAWKQNNNYDDKDGNSNSNSSNAMLDDAITSKRRRTSNK